MPGIVQDVSSRRTEIALSGGFVGINEAAPFAGLDAVVFNRTLPRPTFPPPRVGLNDKQGGAPSAPYSGQDRPEDSVALAKSRSFDLPMQDGELLSQGEVFGGQLGAIAE
jgi:hypothetical protein